MHEAEQPRYYHLLSERELRDLRPLLKVMGECRAQILASWYERYVDHFAESVTLPRPVFLDLFGRDLDSLIENLGRGDMDGFATDERALGRELVERGVPFAEVIASLHLFEESASRAFGAALAGAPPGAPLYATFDKLSHCRLIVLSEAYFAEYRAETALRIGELESEAARLAGGIAGRARFHGLIGESRAMVRVYEQIQAAASGQGTVFVIGESGTGKELVARAVHELSSGSDRPFVAVNCAALPRELVESELFGHRKGAYTGAQGDSLGLIRAAASGTLFLDEITEMAVETQAKLLRVIEERMVRPVGATRELPVEVRFIASSNRDPLGAVNEGRLRQDLYYRLNVHRIALPPLRERLEDIPLLVTHFARLLGSRGMRCVSDVDDDALAALQRYGWPGNVRELRSAVEYALTVGTGGRLRRIDLPPHLLEGSQRPPGPVGGPAAAIPTLEQAERDLIVRALQMTGGNKKRAAQLLRISRHRLYDKLRKYRIDGGTG